MTPLQTIRERFSLRASTDVDGTITRVTRAASLSTENLWLLFCSAILASIGLDTSSAAVVIGAMLISPLMGPILGVGLSMGVTDRHLLQLSLRELAIGTALSLGASALYFLVSPFAAATPELVARTRPTLLDVGVAFFGGVAGIVAGSRRDISLALPGVAIATALMPPLCTAGFGLATGNWSFFFGAFYLFVLNAIFIALATFAVVRLLRFPHHEEATARERQLEHRVIAAVTILAALPSIYFLYDTALKLREQRRITSFVQGEVERPGRAVQQWEHRHNGKDEVLKVYIAGQPVEAEQADTLRAALARYSLDGMRLDLVQSDVSVADLTRLEGEVQRGILRAVTTATAARDSIASSQARQAAQGLVTLAEEIRTTFPEVTTIWHGRQMQPESSDTAQARRAFLLSFAANVRPNQRRDIVQRVRSLVMTRYAADSVLVEER
ncbi:MAG: DUF389 domain-containing protein [Gemmatimonadota bacterium]